MQNDIAINVCLDFSSFVPKLNVEDTHLLFRNHSLSAKIGLVVSCGTRQCDQLKTRFSHITH